MQLLVFFFYSTIALYLLLSLSVDAGAVVPKTITVDPHGTGSFFSVQQAIDSVPDGNKHWIRISLTAGIYEEQVVVPIEKEFILLEGEGALTTVIQWNDHAPPPTAVRPSNYNISFEGATFSCFASNFVARGITFKNTYVGPPQRQAAAILVAGDKISFHQCAFIGYQDTLYDYVGRHYFSNCYIEGAIDYIFGNGQSIYERCRLNTVGHPSNPGWLTAQARSHPNETSGFLFRFCIIKGRGRAYLGRPWGPYARVVFFGSYMDGSVVPAGWDTWVNDLRYTYYAEYGCKGSGAARNSRTKWEKNLTPADIQLYRSNRFIDEEGWLERQP